MKQPKPSSPKTSESVTQKARAHINRIQNLDPTPENIMREHELQLGQTVAIPSGPFWSQT